MLPIIAGILTADDRALAGETLGPHVGRINQRDIPLVQASGVLFAMLCVGLNLIVDLLYAQLDPRIRLR